VTAICRGCAERNRYDQLAHEHRKQIVIHWLQASTPKL
jgi:hypothetical protein